MPVCPKCNTIYTGSLKYCSGDGTPLISCSEEVYLPIGEVINESLSIIARLRTDRLGVVYQAADRIMTGRAVCLRLFHPGVAVRATFDGLEKLGNLLREELDCLDIVTNYITIELEDGRQALISDFCPGDMFDNILTRESPLPAKVAVSILLQLAEILNTAHAAGFIHGGLTPENVLVMEHNSEKLSIWPKSSQFKLVDFGIGRMIAIHNPRGLKQYTGEMMVRNYSTYYAPEVFVGNPDHIDVQSDVYSLGALCYHMLSGLPPFVSDDSEAEGRIYITDDPRPLLMLRPELEVPRALETLILQALSRDHSSRHGSMTQFIEQLQEIYFDLSVLAPSNTDSLKKVGEQDKVSTSELIQRAREGEKMANDRLAQRAREREKMPTNRLVEKKSQSLPDPWDGIKRESISESLPEPPQTPPPASAVVNTPPKPAIVKVPGEVETPGEASRSLNPAQVSTSSEKLPASRLSAEDMAVATNLTSGFKQYTSAIDSEINSESVPNTDSLSGTKVAAKAKTIRSVRRKRPRVPLTYWLMFVSAGFALLFVVGILAVALFQPAVGGIVITTAPSGAQIALDGRVIGQAPAEIEDVPAGPHRILVTKNGFGAVERQVMVFKKQTVTLPLLSLQPDRIPIDVTGTPEERVDEFNRLAEEAYARSDYVTPENNNALYFSNAVLAINPADAQAVALVARVKETLIKQAETAHQKGDFATAQQIYSQLVEKFPEDKQAGEALKRLEAELESRRGQLTQLLQQGEAAFVNGRLIEPAPNCAYYFAAQMLAIERGNQAALRLRARVKEALLKEADQLVAHNDLRNAVDKYERLMRLFPEDRRIPGQLKTLNDQIAQQAANDPKKRRESGLQKYNSGDYAGAAADLEQAVKGGIQDNETLYYLAAADWKRGRLPEASKRFSQILEQNPNHAASLAALGQIAETHKDNTTAISYYERAAKAGGSAEFSTATLQKRIESLKAEMKPKEKQPEPFSTKVSHEHTFGSCSGMLEVSAQGVRYSSSNSDHSFNVPLNAISDLNPSTDKISLKAGDKRYTFKFPEKNAERFRQAYYDFFRLGTSAK